MPEENEDLTKAPEGVSDEEWGALGDPGKRAILRERRRVREILREKDAAVAERDRILAAMPKPPAGAPAPKDDDKGKDGQQGGQLPNNLDEIIKRAIAAATAPLQDKITDLSATRVVDRLEALAADVLIDPRDAGLYLDVSKLVTPAGEPDEQAMRDALAALVENKSHLAKRQGEGTPAPGQGRSRGSRPGGAGQPAAPDATERVKAHAARLAKQRGGLGSPLVSATEAAGAGAQNNPLGL